MDPGAPPTAAAPAPPTTVEASHVVHNTTDEMLNLSPADLGVSPTEPALNDSSSTWTVL